MIGEDVKGVGKERKRGRTKKKDGMAKRILVCILIS